MPKISVIISVFNAEDCLGQCLDTVLTQTLQEIEVICVENGSTDGSLGVLQMYAMFDERLKVIQQEKTAQSVAWNNGLKNATGEFVCFMKTDDFYPANNILQTLYEQAKSNNVSVCGGELAQFDPRQPQLTQNFEENSGFVFVQDGMIEYPFYQCDGGLGRFIFNREFLWNNRLCLPEYVHGFEECFLVAALHVAQKFYALHQIVYAQKTGTSVQFHWSKEKINDYWAAITDNMKIAHENSYYQLKDLCCMKLMILFPVTKKYLSEEERFALLKQTAFLYDDVEKKVSIIVPVYNEEKYLAACLDSVLNQSLKDIEIICVDDGSTDASPDILKKYAEKDARIQIITQNHQGQGVARNTAFTKVNGEYIQYVDSDDRITTGASEYLYLYAKLYALDMVPFAAKNIDERTGEEYEESYTTFTYLPKEYNPVLNARMARSFLPQMAVSAALTFYRKDFLENNSIEWSHLNYEDTLFFTESILTATRFGILENRFYIRSMHDDSITGSINDNFGDYCDILDKTFQKVDELSDRSLLHYYIQYFLIKTHTILTQRLLPEAQNKFTLKFYKLCVKVLKKYHLPLPPQIEMLTTRCTKHLKSKKQKFAYYKALYISKILEVFRKGRSFSLSNKGLSGVYGASNLANQRTIQRFVNSRYHFVDYKTKKTNKVSVLVLIHGGLGDALINLNWLYLLEQKFKSEPLYFNVMYHTTKVFCALNSSQRIYKNIFPKGAKWPVIYNYDWTTKYDVEINMMRVPYIKLASSSLSKIQTLTPLFYKYILACQRFYKLHPVSTLWKNNLYDCEVNDLSLALGHQRIQQSNIDDLLPISENFAYVPSITKNEQEVLKKFDLKTPFITINRGVDGNSKTPNHTKLWTVSGYNELIKLIKLKYPKYQLVQLGVSRDRCEVLKNIDVNLIGRTNLEEVKVLLKDAYLHIDSEGGMVHLRHALTDKKSVVIFGPTSPEVYGYSNNLNIRSKVCPSPCEWIRHDWTSKCWKTHKEAICMKELSAKMVFNQIEQKHLLK